MQGGVRCCREESEVLQGGEAVRLSPGITERREGPGVGERGRERGWTGRACIDAD